MASGFNYKPVDQSSADVSCFLFYVSATDLIKQGCQSLSTHSSCFSLSYSPLLPLTLLSPHLPFTLFVNPMAQVSNLDKLFCNGIYIPLACLYACWAQVSVGSGCNANDSACLCKDSTYISESTACLEKTCQGADLQTALNIGDNSCRAIVRLISS